MSRSQPMLVPTAKVWYSQWSHHDHRSVLSSARRAAGSLATALHGSTPAAPYRRIVVVGAIFTCPQQESWLPAWCDNCFQRFRTRGRWSSLTPEETGRCSGSSVSGISPAKPPTATRGRWDRLLGSGDACRRRSTRATRVRQTLAASGVSTRGRSTRWRDQMSTERGLSGRLPM